ncbi:MAG: hypothetical protein KDA92_01370 [Planctomycetales bacterium]|nr:hypothetical protein [Planctomycetales bacterium]MCA9169482.1 hypothetical protein [Planctomycetales bacterium]
MTTICFLLAIAVSVADHDSLLKSEVHPLDNGTMQVWAKPADLAIWVKQRQSAPLLVHFHGRAEVVADAFARSGAEQMLVVVNFPGLSSAYRSPVERDPQLLSQILKIATNELTRWERSILAQTQAEASELALPVPIVREHGLTLSSFSAGYGAVRELLKSSDNFSRIDNLFLADSLYASLAQDDRPVDNPGTMPRLVFPDHMREFLTFAEAAVAGKKHFAISHSAQTTPYASTTETADYLLTQLHVQRENVTSNAMVGDDEPHCTSRAHAGQFIVLGYDGTSGQEHMWHLYHIERLWSAFQATPSRTPSGTSKDALP